MESRINCHLSVYGANIPHQYEVIAQLDCVPEYTDPCVLLYFINWTISFINVLNFTLDNSMMIMIQ